MSLTTRVFPMLQNGIMMWVAMDGAIMSSSTIRQTDRKMREWKMATLLLKQEKNPGKE
jgi:hypothetical protein